MAIGQGRSEIAVDLTSLALEAEVVRRVPRVLAMHHDVLSIAADGNQLTVAMADAHDQEAIDRIRLATGMHVRALPASREAIRAQLALAYGVPSDPNDDAPAVRAVDAMHERAARDGASDVHLEPFAGGGRIRQRVDGALVEVKRLPAELFAQVVSRIKLLAGMDIADRRSPQDGRYSAHVRSEVIDARVSSMPTIDGEKLVVRLLRHAASVPTLEQLGVPQRYLAQLRSAVHAPYGFVVVCGPTGSGKTTTLYAAMSERNVETQSLCSIEDPVEVRVTGVAQVQVQARAGVTFASAVRSFLRQDPSAIMIGEMRDAQTAAAAISASLCGSLVMTTLHSNDAPRTVERLCELGVERASLSAALTAIVAQRLVRRLCAACRAWKALDAGVLQRFGVRDVTHGYSAAGCERCRGTGYSGRTGIFEAIFVDAAVREAIAGGESGARVALRARENGYRPMLEQALGLALAGETSFEEVQRVVASDAA